jgi:Putative auto-transporter adhesin, head GIN domain
MKKLVVLSFVLISNLFFGQITKSVGDFNKVTSFDQIDVRLIKGTENKILLSGNEADEVELINKNGELKIRMPLAQTMTGENISATVYYIKIDAVEANEGSRISSEDVFEGFNFNIIAKEGAKIDLRLKVDSSNIKISSGAIVKLEGTAKNQDAVINSGGQFEAENLKTTQTTVTVNAGGEAEIFATDFVDAKTRAGGNIIVYGNPKQLNQKNVLGGTIVKK